MLLVLPDEEAPAAVGSATATAPALLLLFDADEADGLLVRRDERRRDPVSFDPVSFDDFLLAGGLVSILLACDAACDEPAALDGSELVGPSLFFLLPDLPIDTRLCLVGSCSRLEALASWSSLRLWSSLLPTVAFRPRDAFRSPALLFARLEDDDGWMLSVDAWVVNAVCGGIRLRNPIERRQVRGGKQRKRIRRL